MIDRWGVTRRDAITLAAAGLGSLLTTKHAYAQASPTATAGAGEFLIRGGHVVSVDRAIGELARGDVHVRGGAIVAVGEEVAAPGATVIDARDMIVMPGFVETHWHMWNSIWRGLVNDATAYFQAQALAAHYTVDDHYNAVRYAALEAVSSGITTCHNWAHGVRDFADVEAEMRALVDSGLRARMGYVGVTRSGVTSRADFERALDWIARNGEGRLSLSMLLDGANERFPDLVRLGRELRLRTISDHGGFMAQPDLVGPEFLLTHGTSLTPDQIAFIAQRGVKVGLCPGTDPLIGAGLPPILALLDGGVPLSNLSFTVDVTAQTPADPFEMLRTLINAGRIQQAASSSLTAIAQARPDWHFSYRDAIELGTLSGANVLGIADQTGSLTPGKRADVIVVRKGDVNMMPAPGTDAPMQLVQHAQPANVDTVFIDGRLRKQAGRLVGVDVGKVVADAAASQVAVRERARQAG